MRKIISILSGTFLMIIIITACRKNTLHTSERESTANKSFLRIAYLVPSVTNQGVQVKINDQRVSSILNYSFGLPGGGTNISGANSTDYLSVDPGQVKVDLSIPKAGTNTDSVPLFNTRVNVEAGNRNTLYITDSFPAITSFIVPDSAARPDSGLIQLRFVHAMPDIPAVDVYKNAVLLFSNVPYKGSSGYTTTSVGSDTFKIRMAGAAPNAATIVTRVFATSNQKTYVFLSRGYRSLSGVRGPQLSNLLVN